jgi:hypothetical protein
MTNNSLRIDAQPVFDPEEEARRMQGLAAGIDTDEDTVTFCGKAFRIGTKVGLMPLMKFAVSSKRGADSADMEGLVAMYEMLADCIHPEDWVAFQDHATLHKAEGDELMEVVGKVISVLSARPTRPRSGSSSGSPTTTESSTDGSWRQEPQGLPPTLPRVEDLVQVGDLGKSLVTA